MLDWIFEGIVTWISSVMTLLMDAVSGLFLDALGTDMVVMEEYFPFVTKAFGILQYTASITQFERGEALICSNNNKVPVVIKASKDEQEMITTDRAELEAILRDRQKENTHVIARVIA